MYMYILYGIYLMYAILWLPEVRCLSNIFLSLSQILPQILSHIFSQILSPIFTHILSPKFSLIFIVIHMITRSYFCSLSLLFANFLSLSHRNCLYQLLPLRCSLSASLPLFLSFSTSLSLLSHSFSIIVPNCPLWLPTNQKPN